VVVLSYQKTKSDGINIYAQRDNEAEFVFLARDTQTRYVDNRPLLAAGKPELRRYTVVYVVKDQEVGNFSDELVVSCAP
jgi:fibronectin type 3 domain-containing protein